MKCPYCGFDSESNIGKCVRCEEPFEEEWEDEENEPFDTEVDFGTSAIYED